jgi:hypothetical protein
VQGASINNHQSKKLLQLLVPFGCGCTPDMARLESISTVVEQERLLALVDAQRQHIAELRTQLNEALASICDITSAPLFAPQPTLQQARTVTAVRGPTAACHERHCPGVTTVHD